MDEIIVNVSTDIFSTITWGQVKQINLSIITRIRQRKVVGFAQTWLECETNTGETFYILRKHNEKLFQKGVFPSANKLLPAKVSSRRVKEEIQLGPNRGYIRESYVMFYEPGEWVDFTGKEIIP